MKSIAITFDEMAEDRVDALLFEISQGWNVEASTESRFVEISGFLAQTSTVQS